MSTGIEVEHEYRDGICVVRLNGTLDLSLGDHKILQEGAQQVVFDFDGIRRVTSFGILMWTRAVEEISVDYIGMWRCRPCIVQQLNVVSDFARKCDLVSVYLPYACEECDKEFDVLWDLRDKHAHALKGDVGQEPCPKCGRQADFDDLPSNYFAFSHRIAAPAPPSAVAARLLSVEMSQVGRGARDRAPPARSSTLDATARAAKQGISRGKGGL